MENYRKNIVYIKEVIRQFCHPETGLCKNIDNNPRTIIEWYTFLNGVYGWVNIGIDEKIANIFQEIKIGEVIPSNPADMNLNKEEFATSEIKRILGVDHPEKNYRLVMNYYSFLRLVQIMLISREAEYCLKINESLKRTFTDIHPKTFWLNILISNKIAIYLKSNEIGEVIIKDGVDNDSLLKNPENAILPAIYENLQLTYKEITEEKNEEEINEEIIKEINEELNEDLYAPVETVDKTMDDYTEKPFRLVVNNSTLLKLIDTVCYLLEVRNDDLNLFELMGGHSDEFSGLFEKLQL